MSFLTSTVFGSGAAPTVTVTPLPQMITQMVTITVSANNQAAVPVPAASQAPASNAGPSKALTTDALVSQPGGVAAGMWNSFLRFIYTF